MLLDRLARPVRLALYAAAVLVLVYMCLAPTRDLPSVADRIWDKAEHAIAWTVLTLLGLVLSTHRRWAIGLFAFIFGAVIEALQANMGWGRDGDWRDLIADAIGIAVAYLVWGGVRWVVRRPGAGPAR